MKPTTTQDAKRKANKPAATPADTKTAVLKPETSGEIQKMVSLNIMLLAVVIGLLISNSVLAWYAVAKKVEVIAVTESGQISHPVPINKSFVTEPRVLAFVDECLRASFSHDFENFRRTFNMALPCYTSAGGKELAKAIENLLTEIKTKRLVMSVSNETPTIVRGPRLVNGVVTWEVEVVMTMFFQGTRERFPSQQRMASVTIVRVPIEEDPRGIAINAIQVKPYSKGAK